jgi:glycosyltransferase involved in cell wall biosynthesis
VCVAHGFPRADAQGWIKMLAILASYRLRGRSARLVAVSHYAQAHLIGIFNLRVDAVIHNPLNRLFLEERAGDAAARDCITFVGRLHPVKRLDRILPAICALVEETPGLRARIIGDGALRGQLEALAAGNPRVEFLGLLPPAAVRAWLRRTRVFVSGCETEALGIAYLEALSQGCAVVMPACGGGLEIAPGQIGKSIRLLPLTFGHQEILSVLREALSAPGGGALPSVCAPADIAARYLELDRERAAAALALPRRAEVSR